MNGLNILHQKLIRDYISPNEMAKLFGVSRDRIERLLTGEHRVGVERKEIKRGSFGYKLKPATATVLIDLFKENMERLMTGVNICPVPTTENKRNNGLIGMQEALTKNLMTRNEWIYLKQYHQKEFFRRENPNASGSPFCLIAEKIDECTKMLHELREKNPEIQKGTSRQALCFR